jgi:hypothetical protein
VLHNYFDKKFFLSQNKFDFTKNNFVIKLSLSYKTNCMLKKLMSQENFMLQINLIIEKKFI